MASHEDDARFERIVQRFRDSVLATLPPDVRYREIHTSSRSGSGQYIFELYRAAAGSDTEQPLCCLVWDQELLRLHGLLSPSGSGFVWSLN